MTARLGRKHQLLLLLVATPLASNVCFWAGEHLIIQTIFCLKKSPTFPNYILQIPGNSHVLALEHNRQ